MTEPTSLSENIPSFIDAYKKYHTMCTDGDEHFGELLAIQMLGHVLGRKCIHLIQPGEVYHNIYLGLIGDSTISRKSTSQLLGKRIFPSNLNHCDDFSPEQFVVNLSENPQNMLWYGEFTYMLKAIGNSNYMSRIVEILNHIFDCPPKFERKIRAEKDAFVVKEPYLSINTTCTNEMMIKYVNKEMLEGGFLARFLLYEGKVATSPRSRINSKYIQLREVLQEVLQELSEEKTKLFFVLSDEALKRFQEIEKELYEERNILPFVGRYLNYIISISDILLVSDSLGARLVNDFRVTSVFTNRSIHPLPETEKGMISKLVEFSLYRKTDYTNHTNYTNYTNDINYTNYTNHPNPENTIIVETEYVNRAYEIVKKSISYIKELTQYTETKKPIVTILRYMRKHHSDGSEISRSDLIRNTNLDSKEMILAIDTLIEQGRIEMKEYIKTTKNGRQYISYSYVLKEYN